MSLTIFAMLIFAGSLLVVCKSQWIEVSDPLLESSMDCNVASHHRSLACGTYNDSIFLMGECLIEYRISSNTIVDRGNSLPHHEYGWGMYYSQWQNKLYTTHSDRTNIHIYNLSSPIFPNKVESIAASISHGSGVCVAAAQDFVYLTGGHATDRVLSILSVSTSIWSVGSSMQHPRSDQSCIVAANNLYVIGGNSLTLETIATNVIQNKEWEVIGSLPGVTTDSMSLLGTALFENIIWIVGGRGSSQDDPAGFYTYSDKVWNVDTTDGSVTLLSERMPYGVARASTLIANNVLYAFGGIIVGNTNTLKWMKYAVGPTRNPTAHPSKTPSNAPTQPPSVEPSVAPTKDPSTTISPSSAPTDDPSTTISRAPSSAPSAPPSAAPSAFPIGSIEDLKTTSIPKKSVKRSVDIVLIAIIVVIVGTLAAIIAFGRRLLRMVKESKENESMNEMEVNQVISDIDSEIANDPTMSGVNEDPIGSGKVEIASVTTNANTVFNAERILKGSAKLTKREDDIMEDEEDSIEKMYIATVTKNGDNEMQYTDEGSQNGDKTQGAMVCTVEGSGRDVHVDNTKRDPQQVTDTMMKSDTSYAQCSGCGDNPQSKQ